MANERKVYVGEAGVKELYRKIKSLIPPEVIVDDALNVESRHPISNHAVTEALNNFGGYLKVDGTGADNHPDVSTPSPKYIYLVRIDTVTTEDKYKEWIWTMLQSTQAYGWDCIGDTGMVPDSWKIWSEDNNSSSTAVDGTGIYIGSNNTIGYYGTSSLIAGHGNTANSNTALMLGNSNSIPNTGSYTSITVGHNNENTGGTEISIFGYNNTISGAAQNLIVAGRLNDISGVASGSVFGSENKFSGDQLITVIGNSNTGVGIDANGSPNKGTAYESAIIGVRNKTTDVRLSTSVGYNNSLSHVQQSAVFGYSNTLEPIQYIDSSTVTAETIVVGTSAIVKGTKNAVVGSTASVKGERNAVLSLYGNVNGDWNTVITSFGSVGNVSKPGAVKANYNLAILGEGGAISEGSNNNFVLAQYQTIEGSHNRVMSSFGNTTGDYNVNIGWYNSLTRNNTILIGHSNSASFDDDTDYSNTDVTSIGQTNTATNAANAYQLGRNNTITGNNLALAALYPHSLSVNIGRNNTITGEGFNLGKDNTADTFGMTLGQGISASGGSVSIGRSLKDVSHLTGTMASGGSVAIGINAVASTASIAIAQNPSAANTTTASNSSIAIGAGNTANSMSYVFGSNNTSSNGSFAFGANNNLSTSKGGYAVGANNTIKAYSFAVGFRNTLGSDDVLNSNIYAFGDSNIIPSGEVVVAGLNNRTNKNSVSGSPFGKVSIFGHNNAVIDSAAQVFGAFNTNIGANSVAMGIWNSNVSGTGVAVGVSNKAQNNASAFGQENEAYNGSTALGVSNKITSSGTTGAAIGTSNKILSGGYNIAVGIDNRTSLEAYALGKLNDVSGWTFAYGVGNRTERVNGSHALLLGMYNESSSNKEHLNWEVPASMATSEYLPTRVAIQYTFSEQIIPITALENQGGSVTRITFNYTETGHTTRIFEVYVGETDKTVFDTQSDWIPVSSLTKVYDGEVTFWPQGDRTAIEFTTPFNLSNGKNLVFALYDKTGAPAEYTTKFNIIKTNTYPALVKVSNTALALGNLPSGAWTNAISLIDITIDGYNVSTYDSVFIGDMPETSSILLGARNQSRHHNSILLGYGNRSYRPLPVPQEQLYDDDDGFMVAIGRENRVGRNYDTAIGCKSIANGGHALAIGSYLEANPWQSVLGFYNKVIASDKDGANEYRTSSTYSSGMYAIYNDDYYRCIHDNVTGTWSASDWVNDVPATFVVGTGYTKANDTIVRKNAMELYANGDLKIGGDITASNIPSAPMTDGDYMLKCSVSNGTKTYTWVAMNTATVV